MARIVKIDFHHRDKKYSLELDLDDGAIVENKLKFDVTASVEGPEDHITSESVEVHINLNKQVVVVIGRGNEICRFDLDALEHNALASHEIEEGKPLPVDFEDDVLRDHSSTLSEGVEELISSIPTPDPILGCLIKAGVSVTIGQALACNVLVERQEQPHNSRARAVARCLRKYARPMLGRAFWRLGRCVVSLGLA